MPQPFCWSRGGVDFIADAHGILGAVSEPAEEAMEAMGGTGDTVAGLVSALIESGLSVPEAASIAALANRMAGRLAKPTPGSHIFELITHIPAALSKAMAARGPGVGA